MAWVKIRSVHKAGVGAGGPVTTDAADFLGVNFLIMHTADYSPSGTPPTVESSPANTWVPLTPQDSGTSRSKLWYCANPTVSGTMTFSVTASAYHSIQVDGWSGGGSSPFDQEGGDDVVYGGTTLASGNITPSEADELIVSGTAYNGTGGTASVTSGGLTVNSNDPAGSGTNIGGALASLVHTSGAIGATWTISVTSDIAVTIASFKLAGVGVVGGLVNRGLVDGGLVGGRLIA